MKKESVASRTERTTSTPTPRPPARTPVARLIHVMVIRASSWFFRVHVGETTETHKPFF